MVNAANTPRLVPVEDDPGPSERGSTTVHDALRTAFRAHHGMVYATAHRILVDAHDAEDITQSVFEKLARRLDTVRDHACMGAFLKACTVRECLALLRRRRWWRGRRAAKVLVPSASDAEPCEAFLVTAVRELLAPLTGEERTAVVLKLVEECSHEEVAVLMQTSVATARRRLASACRRMRKRADDDIKRRLVQELEVSS